MEHNLPTDPSRWRTNADDSLVCPHRDGSVCHACADNPDIVDVFGAHFHLPDPAERAILAEEVPS